MAAICKAAELAGGSCLLYLKPEPGGVTAIEDTGHPGYCVTLLDQFRAGYPFGWTGHVIHDAQQDTDANQPPFVFLPNGFPALSFYTTQRLVITGTMAAGAQTICAVDDEQVPGTILLGSGSFYLYSQASTFRRIYYGVFYNGPLAVLGLHTRSVVIDTPISWLFDGDTAQTSGLTIAAQTLIYLGNLSNGFYPLNGKIAMLVWCTGNHPELHTLTRQYAQLMMGAP
jgi:hypothetical protein